MKTLYDQLGVTPLASHTAIQQSYFRLAKKLDPNSAGGERTRAEYLAVQHAFRTLSNSQSRADYDRSLLTQAAAPVPKTRVPRQADKRSTDSVIKE